MEIWAFKRYPESGNQVSFVDDSSEYLKGDCMKWEY